ncbi:DNase I-like protein [Basidiobolus meristosporus CBS 931.73]|uniref:DNase I-like protein n=1 Tax=Basidiobolus meristosporus CBS 931.73 TaxID=1314790 RepID=A0A1Y1Z749_9FUNG|nr:DNase I-like protein [Basidiobolus meristosporus CBS 931.73]|eukprot:ORY06073.1 DNase I-like protein [Basidiobolus meristosporus CBS 931.73]
MNSLWSGVRQALANKTPFFTPGQSSKKREFSLHTITKSNSSCTSSKSTEIEEEDKSDSISTEVAESLASVNDNNIAARTSCKIRRSNGIREPLGPIRSVQRDSDETKRIRWEERQRIRKERKKRKKKLAELDRRKSLPAPKPRIRVEDGEQDNTEKLKSSTMRYPTISKSVKNFFSAFETVLQKRKYRETQRYSSLFDHPNETTDKHSLKVFVGTWNMYGKPAPKALHPFIETPNRTQTNSAPYLSTSLTHPYHLLVIGTQECQRPISESVLFPSKEEWENQLIELLGPQYVLVKTETMVALHLAVFVWKECKHWIKDKHSGQVATGIGGVIANKGGVGISLLFGTTSFLFINSHFTAHEHKVVERNYDYKRIERELRLDGYDPSKEKAAFVSDRFDYTFWFGDLNYRVMEKRSVIDAKLKEGDLKYLHAREQLMIERSSGNVFDGFDEGLVNFPPTYKFDVVPHNPSPSTNGEPLSDPDIYDSSSKARIPSWTDRVLFKGNGGKVKVYQYTSLMDMRGSDHKPVVGIFSVEFNWRRELILELQKSFEQGTVDQTIEQQRDLRLAKEQNAFCTMQ